MMNKKTLDWLKEQQDFKDVWFPGHDIPPSTDGRVWKFNKSYKIIEGDCLEWELKNNKISLTKKTL